MRYTHECLPVFYYHTNGTLLLNLLLHLVVVFFISFDFLKDTSLSRYSKMPPPAFVDSATLPLPLKTCKFLSKLIVSYVCIVSQDSSLACSSNRLTSGRYILKDNHSSCSVE